MSSAQIPTFVIGGYLGAGKTTFINAFLATGTPNVAVVVNDFGEVNIDAALISERHADTIELTNGCVCCAVGQSLADTLYTLLDRPHLPAMILIEASGVADPSNVAAYTHIAGLAPAGVLVLVDAREVKRTHANPLLRTTIERQLRSANLLAITKHEIATSGELADAQTLITTLAPTTTAITVDTDVLAHLMASDDSATPRESGAPHARFSTTLHHFTSPPSQDELVQFLSGLSPSVVRAKGIVMASNGSAVLGQKTGQHFTITPTTLPPTGIVVISAD